MPTNKVRLSNAERQAAFRARQRHAGKVAPQASDLGFTGLRTSYGVGFRVHNRQATVGSVDLGHSRDGWRVVVKFSDPFKRSTLSGGRTEVIPFVP